MRRRYLKLIAALLLFLCLVLTYTNYHNYSQLKNANDKVSSAENNFRNKTKELDEKITKADKLLNENEDKYYEEKLVKLLDKQQLDSMAKNQWSYTLTANGETFKDNYMYLYTKDIMVALTESTSTDQLLPKNILKSGTVSGFDKDDKFYDHLIISTTVPYERVIKDYDTSTVVYYVFRDVPVGTIITLRLSEALKNRLNVKDNNLEIIINKLDG